MPLGSIQKRSAKGRWSSKRQNYTERKAEKVSKNVNDIEIKQTVKELKRIVKSAGKLLTMVNRAIGQLDKAAYVSYDEQEVTASSTENSDGSVTDKSLKKRKMKTSRMDTLVDAKRASELAKALVNLKDVMTGDNGLADNTENVGVIEIAAASAIDPRPGDGGEDEDSMDAAAQAGGNDVTHGR